MKFSLQTRLREGHLHGRQLEGRVQEAWGRKEIKFKYFQNFKKNTFQNLYIMRRNSVNKMFILKFKISRSR